MLTTLYLIIGFMLSYHTVYPHIAGIKDKEVIDYLAFLFFVVTWPVWVIYLALVWSQNR